MRLLRNQCVFPLSAIILWWFSPMARGDVIVYTMGVTVTEEFTSFAGEGFTSGLAVDQLDSDSWRVTGFSDGDVLWGDDKSTGDFARGEDLDGGVSTGGVYAFDVNANTILGIQPIEADFTPGTIELRVLNETGTTVPDWDVSYDLFYHNDQNRANSFNLSYSTDGSNYSGVPALDFTSPEAADASPSFAHVSRSTNIPASVNDGGYFYLRWTGDDVSGSGARDEFGLDNVSITPNPEPGTLLLGAVTSLGFLAYGVARRRAARRRRE